MKWILPLLSLTLISGCATNSVPKVPENNVTPVLSYNGGAVFGDTAALYWYTFQQNRPVALSEHVYAGDYGEYRSEFHWRGDVLREAKREGTQSHNGELTPFTLHVRYDTKGNPVYQRYSVDGEFQPMSSEQLEALKRQANMATDTVTNQRLRRQTMIQGSWRDGSFYRCSDNEKLVVEFDQPQPDYLMAQLSKQRYMAVVGKTRLGTLHVADILVLNEGGQCQSAPDLLED